MTVLLHFRLVPWDDPAFVATFEQIEREMTEQGWRFDAPPAAYEVQRRLRRAGYRAAVAHVDRTVDEALAHSARWVISRDGDRAIRQRIAATA